MNELKFSKRNRNGKIYVSVRGYYDYNTLIRALVSKYPNVRITSGGAYTSVTGVLE